MEWVHSVNLIHNSHTALRDSPTGIRTLHSFKSERAGSVPVGGLNFFLSVCVSGSVHVRLVCVCVCVCWAVRKLVWGREEQTSKEPRGPSQLVC